MRDNKRHPQLCSAAAPQLCYKKAEFGQIHVLDALSCTSVSSLGFAGTGTPQSTLKTQQKEMGFALYLRGGK